MKLIRAIQLKSNLELAPGKLGQGQKRAHFSALKTENEKQKMSVTTKQNPIKLNYD